MTWFKRNIWEIVFVTGLFIVGLCIRLQGISTNHSFWADESAVSSFSRDVVLGKTPFLSKIEIVGYQRLQVVTTAIAFRILGFSEWSARLPSVLWGTFGIIFVYLLTRKLSNKWGGVLSATIFTLFQLNLAYSTQAKPYAAIETIFLITLYLSTFLQNDIRKISLHIGIILLSCIAALYNLIGSICFIPYLCITIPLLFKNPKQLGKYLIALVPIFLVLFWWQRIYLFLPIIINPNHNWTTFLRDLFWRQYGLFTLPAFVGFFTIEDRRLKLGVGATLLALLYSWNFIQYSHNIRYLMPLFGLIIVFFGVFWAKVGESLFKNSLFVCLAVFMLVYAGGYKVVRKPAAYYTPNADFSSDVQNADYKTFFQKTYQLFPNFDKLPVFVGPFDTLSWYTDKNPAAIFTIDAKEPRFLDFVKSWQYRTLKDFKIEKAKYHKGLVIVNDWQSLMPEDIKEFVKKNMKLELRVEAMEISTNDKWPLELYSWGFDIK